MSAPDTRVYRIRMAGLVSYRAIRLVITDVRGRAARIITKKKAGPAVMMHRLGRTDRRQRNLEHTDECILKNNFVACRRSLNGIETVGKPGFVLPVKIGMSRV